MGVRIPVGFSQVAVVFTCTGAPHELISTWGVATVSTPPEDVASETSAVLISVGLVTAASMTVGYQAVEVRATTMLTTGPVTFIDPLGFTGTVSSQTAVPVNSAILVQKRTARGGRNGRGRLFWPPAQLLETTVTPSGLIGSTQLTDQQTKFDNLLTGLAAQDVAMMLLHDSATLAPDEVTSLIVQATMASQRTRMRS